jgi:hypothetical protein
MRLRKPSRYVCAYAAEGRKRGPRKSRSGSAAATQPTYGAPNESDASPINHARNDPVYLHGHQSVVHGLRFISDELTPYGSDGLRVD